MVRVYFPQEILARISKPVWGKVNLVNTTKSGEATKVVLSSYTAGNYRHTTTINIPATYCKIFKVYIGLQNYHDMFDLS